MTFWLGLIIGLFVGTNLGILVMSWICAGTEADKADQRMQQFHIDDVDKWHEF